MASACGSTVSGGSSPPSPSASAATQGSPTPDPSTETLVTVIGSASLTGTASPTTCVAVDTETKGLKSTWTLDFGTAANGAIMVNDYAGQIDWYPPDVSDKTFSVADTALTLTLVPKSAGLTEHDLNATSGSIQQSSAGHRYHIDARFIDVNDASFHESISADLAC